MEIRMSRVWLAALASLAVMPKGDVSFLFGLPTVSRAECVRAGNYVGNRAVRAGGISSQFCLETRTGAALAWVR